MPGRYRGPTTPASTRNSLPARPTNPTSSAAWDTAIRPASIRADLDLTSTRWRRFCNARPMSILAFDTCFGAVSVAVTSPASGVHEVYEEMAIGQAERLMPMIDEVMRAAGVE